MRHHQRRPSHPNRRCQHAPQRDVAVVRVHDVEAALAEQPSHPPEVAKAAHRVRVHGHTVLLPRVGADDDLHLMAAGAQVVRQPPTLQGRPAGEAWEADRLEDPHMRTISDGAPNWCKTSGTRMVPSSCWWFSTSAMIVRPTATAVPLSVWTSSGLPPSGR
jgi:hypothetical protein